MPWPAFFGNLVIKKPLYLTVAWMFTGGEPLNKQSLPSNKKLYNGWIAVAMRGKSQQEQQLLLSITNLLSRFWTLAL